MRFLQARVNTESRLSRILETKMTARVFITAIYKIRNQFYKTFRVGLATFFLIIPKVIGDAGRRPKSQAPEHRQTM